MGTVSNSRPQALAARTFHLAQVQGARRAGGWVGSSEQGPQAPPPTPGFLPHVTTLLSLITGDKGELPLLWREKETETL